MADKRRKLTFVTIALLVVFAAGAFVATIEYREDTADGIQRLHEQAELAGIQFARTLDIASLLAAGAAGHFARQDGPASAPVPWEVDSGLTFNRILSWSWHPHLTQADLPLVVYTVTSDGTRQAPTEPGDTHPATALSTFAAGPVDYGFDVSGQPALGEAVAAALGSGELQVVPWLVAQRPLLAVIAPVVNPDQTRDGVVLVVVDATPAPTELERLAGLRADLTWELFAPGTDVPESTDTRQVVSFATAGSGWHLAVTGPRKALWTPWAFGVWTVGLLAAVVAYMAVVTRRQRAALSAAQERAADKSWFLQHLAHSIRTPLTAVLGFLEVLRADRAVGDDGRELLDLAAREAEQLSLLTNDLLLAGTLDGEDVGIVARPVPLRPEIERIVGGYITSGAVVTVDGDVTAHTDPLRFRQVFRNVYLDALHHARGRIAINLGTADGLATVTLNVDRRSEDSYRHSSAPDLGELSVSVAQRLTLLLHGHLSETHDGGNSVVTLQLPTVEPARLRTR